MGNWAKDIGIGDTWKFSLDDVEINRVELFKLVDPIWYEIISRKW